MVTNLVQKNLKVERSEVICQPREQLRLVGRSGHDTANDRRTDSPMINKVNVGLFFSVAVFRGWNSKTCDEKRVLFKGLI